MKLLYSLLTLLPCFAATAFGTPMPNQLSNRATCSLSTMKSAMTALRDNVQYPHQFCSWYLSAGRTRSPLNIKGMTVPVLQNACKCLGYSAPTSTPKATTTMTPGAVTTKCPAANIALLESHYTDATAFCEFFIAAPRDTSPLQVLGVKGVWNACNCILGKASTSSSASNTATSSDTTITSSTTGIITPAITTSSFSSSVSGSPYTIPNLTTASITTSSTTSSSSPTATMGYPAFLQADIYWGFSGTPAIGSALQVSSTSIGDQEFTWSNDNFTLGNVGYMVHKDTGLCLTVFPNGLLADVYGQFDGSEVQLQTCGASTPSPGAQTFELKATGPSGLYGYVISADEQYGSSSPGSAQSAESVTVTIKGEYFALVYSS